MADTSVCYSWNIYPFTTFSPALSPVDLLLPLISSPLWWMNGIREIMEKHNLHYLEFSHSFDVFLYFGLRCKVSKENQSCFWLCCFTIYVRLCYISGCSSSLPVGELYFRTPLRSDPVTWRALMHKICNMCCTSEQKHRVAVWFCRLFSSLCPKASRVPYGSSSVSWGLQ